MTPFLSHVLIFIAGALCGGLGFIVYMFVTILTWEPHADGQ
jgi:nitrate reductase NapE component